MKRPFALLVAATLCLFFSACHRPVAYFQRMPYVSARLPLPKPTPDTAATFVSLRTQADTLRSETPADEPVLVVDAQARPASTPSNTRLAHRARRMQRLLVVATATVPNNVAQTGPGPKPKKQLRLGNRIRQSLGLPLREELNWWQRISWKLKASFIVILVAVLFAILGITVLAIIFGLLGAFLLITGLKKSFKTRRPWL